MRFKLFPWPSRQERRTAVEAARLLARESGHQAEEAARLKQDLRRLAAENHFAYLIRAAILGKVPSDNTGD